MKLGFPATCLTNGREECKMNVDTPMSTFRFRLRSVAFTVVLVAAISLVACFLAIPVVIHYYKTSDNYVAEADTNKSADEIWAAVVRLAERRKAEGKIEILERDDADRLIKVTDGVQTAEAKTIPLGKSESRITVMADIPKGEEGVKEKEQELAARIMKNLCEEAKAACKFVEK
jgi:hypothetical protein